MKKNRKDEIGNVYAIITSKGYALGQVAGVYEAEWSGMYHCRIFSTLYPVIPENIADIVSGNEDYVIQLQLPSMAHQKYKMAKKIGKFPFPASYKKPQYVRCSFSIGVDERQVPFKRWAIIPAYGTLSERIKMYDWVLKCWEKVYMMKLGKMISKS